MASRPIKRCRKKIIHGVCEDGEAVKSNHRLIDQRQSVFGQCINRVLPGCGPGVVDGILPNQYLIREPGLPVLPAIPPAYPAVLPGSILPDGLGYAPTIIQDSSVANSLANALQLLVVSNLLSTTLPGGPCDLPYPIDYLGMPAYNYNYIY